MEESNGVFKIPCEVNGLRMKFIFDTGASNVCLSLTEAKFMLENDYITSEDILGNSKAQIADGSIVENTIILLKEIKIAGLVLNDIQAVVTHSIGAPLLLGQSAIQKLGTIQINGNELTILEHNSNLSDEEINEMIEDADKYFERDSYIAASKKFQKLYNLGVLSDVGIFKLALSYHESKKYDEAIIYYNKVENIEDLGLKSYYYDRMGWCYIMLDMYDDALYCFEMQGEKAKDGTSDFFDSRENMAYAYKFKGDYIKAVEFFNGLIRVWVNKHNMTLENAFKQIKKGKLKDDRLNKYIYEMCYCQYMKDGCPTSGIETIIGLAKNGNKYAMDFVKERDLEEFLYY